MLQTQKHRQIQHLRDPNPMEDVPDQDSAINQKKKFQTLFCLPEHSWGNPIASVPTGATVKAEVDPAANGVSVVSAVIGTIRGERRAALVASLVPTMLTVFYNIVENQIINTHT